jgi:hypothetical protein
MIPPQTFQHELNHVALAVMRWRCVCEHEQLHKTSKMRLALKAKNRQPALFGSITQAVPSEKSFLERRPAVVEPAEASAEDTERMKFASPVLLEYRLWAKDGEFPETG